MSADDRPIVEAVRRLQAAVGDCVVITCPDRLSREGIEWLSKAVRPHLPKGVSVLVLEGGMQAAVIGPADAPLTKIRDVLASYEKALANREHGGVAAGRAIDAIATIMEGTA